MQIKFFAAFNKKTFILIMCRMSLSGLKSFEMSSSYPLRISICIILKVLKKFYSYGVLFNLSIIHAYNLISSGI